MPGRKLSLRVIFVLLLALCAGNAQQTVRWSQDIDFVEASILAKDASLTLVSRDQFKMALDDLRKHLPQTEPEIIVALTRAVAGIGNGHTRLYTLRNRQDLRRYPLRVWWFADGLHTVKASAEYSDVVACKIGSVSV